MTLTHFKNYAAERIEFSPAVNFLTGQNGSGKTNLLDAIHYLCLGKSYFHVNDQQAIGHGASFFRLAGEFHEGEEQIRLSCACAGGGKKELTKNGITYQRLTDHVGRFPVVMIAPDDHLLIDEGSDERRRFIDNTISQINHFYLEDLLSYNKVLQHRNAALKQFAFKKTFDAALIETLDEQLAVFGRKIFDYRKKYLERIIPFIENYYSIICAEKEGVTAKYESVFESNDYRSVLKNTIDKDRQLERTTAGIHRDEFEFYLDKLPVRKFGSQGQKKTFLMALKLAQWKLISLEKNSSPLLLLDDLFDKLDANRSHRILNMIAENVFGQVFITDTNSSRVEAVTPSVRNTFRTFEVRDGVVHPVE